MVRLIVSQKTRGYLNKLVKLNPKRIYETLDEFFDEQGLKTASFISANYLSGQRLKRRTGTLARSITGAGIRIGGVPAMRVGVLSGPALAYAGIQETGGTIRAKSKLLAVPPKGSPALTPAGVDRYGGPRGFPGKLSFVPYKRNTNVVGGLYPAAELSRTRNLREIIPAYLLMKKVVIKGQHYLRDGMAAQLPEISKSLAMLLAGEFVSAVGKTRRRSRR